MPVELSIPHIGKRKTVKDHVILILSSQWPLSSRKIYNILIKQYNLSVSYQAVHKAIRELINNGILIREGKELQLNLDWINEVKGFGEKVRDMYENGKSTIDFDIFNFPEDTVRLIKFNSMAEMDKFVYFTLIKERCKEDRPDKCYNYWRYEYWPFFLMEELINFAANIPHPENFFTIQRNNTIIERWTKKLYEKTGLNAKIGINITDNFDFAVFGDEFFQIFFPEELNKKLDKLFSNVKDMNDVDLEELKRIFEEKHDIYMIFGKNKIIAEEWKNLFMRYFNGGNVEQTIVEAKTWSQPEAMVFNSIHDVDKFILKFINSESSNKRQDLFIYWANSWVPLFIEKDTYIKIIDSIKNYNLYSVIKNKTAIELWCKKVVENKVNEKIGIDLEMPDTVVLNDTVIQVFYPEQIKKEIFEVFSKTSDINKLDIDKLFKAIFEKKTSIPVVIHKDKELAEEIKTKIKGYFE